MVDVVVQYKRVDTVFTGTLSIVEDDSVLREEQFSDTPYSKLFTTIAKVLRSLPEDTGLVLLRTEKPGFAPFRVPKERLDLMRSDPVQYIKDTTYDPVVVKVTTNVQSTPQSLLTIGRDTLTGSFGDILYVRRRHGEIECPVCGLWSDSECDYFLCSACAARVSLLDCSDKWAGFRTEDLLQLPVKRFFLPFKEWNNHKNWISKEDLVRKYEEYKKEKEDVRSEAR